MASSVFLGWFGGIKYSTSGTTVTFAGSVAADTIILDSTNQDVVLSRGAANRLDLASGDSLYLVSGGLGVGVANTTVGSILANTTITANGNFITANGQGLFSSSRGGIVLGSSADGNINFVNAAATGPATLGLGPIAAATSTYTLVKKVTGIADNVATDVLTVTIPNSTQSAMLLVYLTTANGSTDAFESSRTGQGTIVITRTTGANAVAAATALHQATIATVAAGATHTLAYGISAIAGAVGDANTFTVQVTIDDSGNLGSNQCVIMAEVINGEATGITIQ